jgi:vitamin B12 transporter
VVVTASRGEESIREVTSNITIIDEQTIQRSPGSTLDSILKREGINIMEFPGQGTAAVELRGIANSRSSEPGGLGARNLLLIDGRPAGTANVAAVAKTNIERIEIIRGPSAIAYGSQVTGGVINVITKRGEGDFSGHGQAGFGSWHYQDQEAGIDGRAGAFDYSLGLFHSSRDNYITGGGDKAIGADQRGTYSGSTNLGYNFLDDQHRIGLSSRFFYNQLQGIGNTIGDPYNNPDNNIKLENESFDLSYTGKNEDGPLAWQLRYFHATDKYFNYDDRAQTVETDNNQVKMDGFQGQIAGDFGLVALTGGLDWQKYDTTRNNPSIPGTPATDMSNTGAYLLGKLRLLDENLIFTGGLRYDTFDNNASGQKKTVDNWSPTLGAAYLPLEWLKLRTNVSKGFRTPTPTELALDYIYQSWGTDYPYLGNPDLDPEYSTNYELGFDVNYDPSWTLGLTYFHTDYENRIASGGSNSGPCQGVSNCSTYSNSDRKTTVSGLEMNASFDFGSYLDWPLRFEPYVKATHNMQRKGGYYPRFADPNVLLSVPKSIITYGLDVDYPDWGLFVNVNARYFSGAVEPEFEASPPYRVLPYEVSYTLVDLTVEKVLVEFADKHKLSAKFAAQNIFDKDYVSYPGYPTPGASVYGGLKYEFN